MMMIGDSTSICEQVQAYFDAGLDGMIFNIMPNARPEEVRQLGQALSQRFGAEPPVGTGAI